MLGRECMQRNRPQRGGKKAEHNETPLEKGHDEENCLEKSPAQLITAMTKR